MAHNNSSSTSSSSSSQETASATVTIADNVSEAVAQRPTVVDDLYRFVSGPWLSTHKIPDDRPVDGTFHALRDQAERDTREIIETAPEQSRIGAAYRSFMDTAGIAKAGLQPLMADLRLLQVDNWDALATALGQLDRLGVGGLAGYFVSKDSASDIDRPYLIQGGLSLPDEAYYREPAHQAIVQQFQEHVAKMFDIARRDLPQVVPTAWADQTSEQLASQIVQFETTLAAGHWDVEQSRDAVKTYNPTDPQQLPTAFPWQRWLAATGCETDMVVVAQPSYLQHVDDLITSGELSLDAVKLWAHWQVLHQRASMLPPKVDAENFAFFGQILWGTEVQRERWKRGVSFVEGHIPDDVGRQFVRRHFPPENKATMDELVGYLIKAYEQRIKKLEWMTPATRERALEKLGTFRAKIGMPDSFKDYSMEFSPKGADLLENHRKGAAWNHDYVVAKVGKPTDRDEWVCPPQMVNAFYNPVLNDITFPAAILRPPFFNPAADMAQNFGAIGAVIGHEIGHGFDDQGSQYDGAGNLNSWWSDEDREAFTGLTDKLVAQFDGLVPTGLQQRGKTDQSVNGRFTLGENIGDLGGLGIAVTAYELYVQDHGPADSKAPFVWPDGHDGEQNFTAMQRMFLSWSLVWRTAIRPQTSAQYLAVDPHSPAEFRCNVIARNVDAFHEAFGTQPGDGMWLDPQDRVCIW